MWKKLIVIAAAASNLVACAPTANLSAQPATARAADPPTCQSQPAAVPGAYVVEGFGGKGDPQLMISEQRPIVRCERGTPAAHGATLGPLH